MKINEISPKISEINTNTNNLKLTFCPKELRQRFCEAKNASILVLLPDFRIIFFMVFVTLALLRIISFGSYSKIKLKLYDMGTMCRGTFLKQFP